MPQLRDAVILDLRCTHSLSQLYNWSEQLTNELFTDQCQGGKTKGGRVEQGWVVWKETEIDWFINPRLNKEIQGIKND